MRSRLVSRAPAACLTALLVGCARPAPPPVAPPSIVREPPLPPDPLAPIASPRSAADRIVNRAKEEARRGVTYDASYVRLTYPGGDVDPAVGACTDVVVRALRAAGHDLQRLVHEDMRAHFALYPHRYGLKRPDPNIDHRRVANLTVFFGRHGESLPLAVTGPAAASWRPGDIAIWKLGNGLDHTGIVSNWRGASGLPTVVHNLAGARQEDCLTAWRIVGHFRYPRGPSGRR